MRGGGWYTGLLAAAAAAHSEIARSADGWYGCQVRKERFGPRWPILNGKRAGTVVPTEPRYYRGRRETTVSGSPPRPSSRPSHHGPRGRRRPPRAPTVAAHTCRRLLYAPPPPPPPPPDNARSSDKSRGNRTRIYVMIVVVQRPIIIFYYCRRFITHLSPPEAPTDTATGYDDDVGTRIILAYFF